MLVYCHNAWTLCSTNLRQSHDHLLQKINKTADYCHSVNKALYFGCLVNFSVVEIKGKECCTPWKVQVGCSSLWLKSWAHWWINHTASAMPDLWLLSQPQNTAALRQRRVCEQLAQGQQNGWESNPRPQSHKSNALSITSPQTIPYVVHQPLRFSICNRHTRHNSINNTPH